MKLWDLCASTWVLVEGYRDTVTRLGLIGHALVFWVFVQKGHALYQEGDSESIMHVRSMVLEGFRECDAMFGIERN